jgi:hypothetical protein
VDEGRRVVVVGCLLAAGVLLGGLGWVLWAYSDAREIDRQREELSRGDLSHRQRALWRMASVGGDDAIAMASDVLENETNLHLREAAAYALCKMQARDKLEQVRAAAIEGPPCEAQAKITLYVAELGGEQVLPWLRQMSESPSSWLGLGAALGRLWLGDLEANDIVFGYLRGSNATMREFAAKRLSDWISLMGEAIGSPAEVPQDSAKGVSVAEAERLIRWWQRHATAKLIRDNVAWDRGRDVHWRPMVRLLRARVKAIEFLGIG